MAISRSRMYIIRDIYEAKDAGGMGIKTRENPKSQTVKFSHQQ